jgi:toxin YoeB
MSKAICWHTDAWEDYLYWQEIDKKMLRKINELIKAIIREPFSGIGKPEPLKHLLEGCWSRRISQEHRLVYKATNDEIIIIQCRYHY